MNTESAASKIQSVLCEVRFEKSTITGETIMHARLLDKNFLLPVSPDALKDERTLMEVALCAWASFGGNGANGQIIDMSETTESKRSRNDEARKT